MAEGPVGYSSRTLVLVIVLVLALLAVAGWQLGYFGSDTDEELRTVYTTDTVDKSGGELIVRDADEPGVEDLELPETQMTPVPPGEEEAAAPADAE